MKKIAWTLAEMMIALLIVTLLSGICVNLFKPNTQKAKLFVYSAIRNLTMANISVIEKYGSLTYSPTTTLNGNEVDWLCAQLSDALSLDEEPNCSISASIDDVNFVFTNGITVHGLTNEWKLPFENAPFFYKNILVDVDGPEKGLNKLWADQFPLRIIGGKGRGAEGLIMPVNCGAEQAYNNATEELVDVAPEARNPYCGSSTKDYTIDKDTISFDIYRAVSTEENAKAELIATGLSPLEADCMALGSSAGYFSVPECSSKGIHILTKCATISNCETCTANNCPYDTDETTVTNKAECKFLQDNVNPENISCFSMIHKPSGGMSFIVQALVGDIDQTGM